MCEANVLDTGVMLGVTIEKDSHHELCFDYVTNGEPCYVSPTVRTEYERKKTGIREDLNQEIVEHRGAFVEEVESDPLTPSAIEWVCAELLDRDMKSFRYLNKYYQKKRDESRVRPIQKVEVEMDLEEMGMEVWEDAAEDKRGRGIVFH
ncbi:type II toxin-antitoxin system VapC family toxin [Halococcus hamelinensis]|uniref:type II toxin-antitoxin system VapC family toxin n=1 Tax=Halococcus hamelinensis TaxID=332168 RepID=UPI00029AF062|nr:hypothetical protein [Halococcus hamelinensis]